MRSTETLMFANGWVVDFLARNGITQVPDWWAYLMQVFGGLSYLSLFCIFLTVMMGYSRQMSSFFFFYEHVVGEKLRNPYRPALFFFFVWFALSVTTFFVNFVAICFYKYGLALAILCGLVGCCMLAFVYFISRYVCDDEPVRVPLKFSPVYSQLEGGTVQQDTVLITESSEAPRLLSPEASVPQTVQAGNPTTFSDRELAEALQLFGLAYSFSKEELKEKYREKLKKVHGDEGLVTYVRSRYEYLLKNYC